jgi:TPR repeat protein
MRWLTGFFGRQRSPTTAKASTAAKPVPKTEPTPIDKSPDPDAVKQVGDALSKFLDEKEDSARLEQVKILKTLGQHSLAPLLHEAFDEYGDPSRESIDIYKIRLAVWCGCALHPQDFDLYYRTKYHKGRTRMLDEMRAINMTDGLNGKTYVHRLLSGASQLSSSSTTKPANATLGGLPELLNSGMEHYAKHAYLEAHKKFLSAADLGSAEARNMLGILYDNGFGVQRNQAEAMKWFEAAARDEYPPAMFCIGVLYRDGRGVSQDLCEAAKWIRKAADKGNDEAQFNLGVMYFRGDGVPQDTQQAGRWWRLAAEQGNANAKQNLSLLMSKRMI